MSVFISYARQDTAAVTVLAGDLREAGQQTWRDTELGGGEDWWQTILKHIRTCSVFVLALSEHSIRSQPCQAELGYATALGIPIVPIQIGPVDSLPTAPIAKLQVVNYQERNATAGIRLVTAVTASAAGRRPLPDPLPNPPPAPFTYLLQVASTIAKPHLRAADQAAAMGQLQRALRNEKDDRARAYTINLLRQLRRHPDCTYDHAQEIDKLLRSVGVPVRHRRLLALGGAVLVLIAAVAVLLVGQGQSSTQDAAVAPAPELVLSGHTALLRTVATTDLDGRPVIISGSDDNTIRIWDPTTGTTLRTLIGHTDWIRSVTTAQLDGRTVIISGSNDRTIRIWDPTTGNTLRTLTGHTDSVNSVTTTELDGRTVIVFGSEDNTIRIWDPTTGNTLRTLTGHTNPVNSITTTELDGRTVIISGSSDNTIRIWDLQERAR